MFVTRSYEQPVDFVAMQRLVARLWFQQAPYVYALPGDLSWWRAATPDDTGIRGATLWYLDDSLVGFVWRAGDDADILYDTAVPGLASAILADVAAKTPPAGLVYAFDRHVDRTDILRSLGYHKGDPLFRMHLMDPNDAPHYAIPQGWEVCQLPAGDAANQDRSDAQRSAFQSTKMTPERYAFARSLPGYTGDWDLVLRTPAGDIAAFVTIWVDHASQTAHFEPVGCVHAYKRQGLTRILLCEALRRLSRAGISTVCVLSAPLSAEHPAGWLYESCGFHLIDHIAQWSRVPQDA